MGVLIPINGLKSHLLKKPFSQKIGYLFPCLRKRGHPRWSDPRSAGGCRWQILICDSGQFTEDISRAAIAENH